MKLPKDPKCRNRCMCKMKSDKKTVCTKPDATGLWMRYQITTGLIRLIKVVTEKNDPQTDAEVDLSIAEIRSRVQSEVYNHAFNIDHSKCGDHNGQGQAWFEKVARKPSGRIVTCPGYMDAFKELIEVRLLSKLKDLIKPKFGMKATNVCESINSICRQWLDKSERPSARQYVAYMALADCHACERAIWIHTDAPTWREKIFAKVARKLKIPIKILMPPAARAAYRKETKDAARRSQRRKNPEFRKRENRRRTKWRKERIRKSGDGYGSAIVDELQLKSMAEGSKKKKLKAKDGKRKASGKCKCGSTDHVRTNHSDCPLNKRNITMTELNNEPVSPAAWEDVGAPHVEATGEYDELSALMAMLGDDGDDTLLDAIAYEGDEGEGHEDGEVQPTV
jgi:hypothetical protein